MIYNIVMLGVTGSGKSTLCNSLAGRCWTKSGLGRARGITKGLTKIELKDGVFLYDSQGYEDAAVEDLSDLNSQLTALVKEEGKLSVIFVVEYHANRPMKYDVTAIQAMYKAVENVANGEVRFGLIINKFETEHKSTWDSVVENGLTMGQLYLEAFEKISVESVLRLDKVSEVSGVSDALLPASQTEALKEFLQTVSAFNTGIGNGPVDIEGDSEVKKRVTVLMGEIDRLGISSREQAEVIARLEADNKRLKKEGRSWKRWIAPIAGIAMTIATGNPAPAATGLGIMGAQEMSSSALTIQRRYEEPWPRYEHTLMPYGSQGCCIRRTNGDCIIA